MRTFIKKVETAIAKGDKAVAVDALRSAQPDPIFSTSFFAAAHRSP